VNVGAGLGKKLVAALVQVRRGFLGCEEFFTRQLLRALERREGLVGPVPLKVRLSVGRAGSAPGSGGGRGTQVCALLRDKRQRQQDANDRHRTEGGRAKGAGKTRPF
jgi:hypothetical protein